MSLTSELKNIKSPTSLYFSENFPDKKNFTQEWKKRTKDLLSILPQNPSSSYPWSLIGHAIDYRIHLFFEKYSADDTVAAFGASLLPPGEIEKTEIDEEDLVREQRRKDLWKGLKDSFEDLPKDIVGKMKSPSIERQIAKCCMVLSYYETQYRSGRQSEPLLHAHTLEDLFSEMSEIVIDDLVNLFRAFFESDKPPSNNVVLNPTFAGSRDVGGADGDIILDHFLWDFKTTKNPSEFHNHFWPYQLIGYVLLDYDDRYALSGCGFYLARQTSWISWDLKEIFDLLGAEPGIDLSAHRERLRNSTAREDAVERSTDFVVESKTLSRLERKPVRGQQEGKIYEEKEDLMQKIRYLRIAHGLTLRGMADRLKVSEREWNRIFNGNLRSSSIETLREYVKKMESWPK